MARRGPFRGRDHFLSNFFIEPNGKNNEARFQAPKTLDEEARKIILAAGPKEAKRLASRRGFAELSERLGRPITLREDWESIKYDVMKWGLGVKFQDPELRQLLLDTGDDELVELNSWDDNEWGSCTCARCGNKGKNHLGRLLMELRAELRQEQALAETEVEPGTRSRLSPLAE